MAVTRQFAGMSAMAREATGTALACLCTCVCLCVHVFTSQRIKVSSRLLLQAQCGGLHCAEPSLLDLVVAVVRLLDMAGLHHDLRRRAVDVLLEP